MFSLGMVCAVPDYTADLAAFTAAAIVCAFDHDCCGSLATIISPSFSNRAENDAHFAFFVALNASLCLRLLGLVIQHDGAGELYNSRGNDTRCGSCVCPECEHALGSG